MPSELTIAAEGKDSTEQVRRILDAVQHDAPPRQVEVRITYATDHSPRDAEPSDRNEYDRPPRVRSGTIEHRTLWLVQEYLTKTGAEATTRQDLAEFAGSDLSKDQIGTALSTLGSRKGLLDVTEAPGPREPNEYQLTDAARRELERLGAPD